MTLLLLLLSCAVNSEKPTRGAPVGPPPDRVEPDQRGPYSVGVSTLVLPDPRGEDVSVEVWYPAIDPGTPPEDYPEFAFHRGPVK